MRSVTDTAVVPEVPGESAARTVEVSVLVPVLNEEPHLRAAADAMRAQDFPGRIELLIVDGRSSDRTPAIARELAAEDDRFVVLDNPAGQTAAGLNVALRHARGEFVARMDAHTYYPPSYLARGVERLRRGDVAWVCGPQIPHGEGRWSRRVALALSSPLGRGPSRRWQAGPGEDGRSGEVELDTGVFTGVWRRSTLEAHGGWDPGWPINQDSELAARVLAAGGRIVSLHELGAHYVPRDSLRRLLRQYWRYGQYRAKTAARHPESLRRSLLLPPALVVCAVAALLAPRPLRRPARAGVGAYALLLAATAVRAAREADPRDAAALPLVFAIMHAGHGAGFLRGSLRFGLPLAGVARALGAGRSVNLGRSRPPA
jgi:succinoglycan biosynthesis protein ExoA